MDGYIFLVWGILLVFSTCQACVAEQNPVWYIHIGDFLCSLHCMKSKWALSQLLGAYQHQTWCVGELFCSLCWVLITSFIRSIPWTTLIAQTLQLYMPPLQVDVFRYVTLLEIWERQCQSLEISIFINKVHGWCFCLNFCIQVQCCKKLLPKIIPSSKVHKPLVQCLKLMGGKHHQQVLPHHILVMSSHVNLCYVSELLTMFSIDVFSMHRKVAQDHPCMSLRASSLNNVRSFDEPATQRTLGKRTLA